MRKNKLFAIIIILSLFFMHFSSSILASEAENIDSFDVFPSNRWSETNNDMTVTVSDGLLNISDIGDGGVDSYTIDRGLRDLDGKIEIRFNANSNKTGTWDDALFIQLIGDTGYLRFYITHAKDDDYWTTRLRYDDVDSEVRMLVLSTNEQIMDNIWYIIRFDYDLLLSKWRVRCFFDNSSRVFDYIYQDISSYRPAIFGSDSLLLRIVGSTYTDGLDAEYLIDYVKAPFKEREWTNSDVPVGFLSNGWFASSAEDNIDDLSVWELTVPYFDAVSGMITGDCEDSTALAAGENMFVNFIIWSVAYNDGAKVPAVNIELRMEEQIAPIVGFGAHCRIYIDSVLIMNVLRPIDDGDIPSIAFSFSTSADRSMLNGEVVFDSGEGTGTYYPQSFSIAMSDVDTDASQEFVLSTNYAFDFDGDTEFYGSVRDLTVIERGIMAGWVIPYPGQEEEGGSEGEDFFVVIFRWIGDLIAAAFETVIGVLTFALEVALGLIEVAIEALEPFLTLIEEAIDDLVAYIQAIGQDVIDYLISVAGDVLEAIFDALALLVDAFADLIFAFWNALSLPDILSVISELLVGLGLIVSGFGQFVTDINALIDNIFTLSVAGGLFVFFFLPITIAPTIGQWIEKVFQFLAFDITFGLSIFGFGARVPVGAVWIAIVIGSGVLSGSILGGFF